MVLAVVLAALASANACEDASGPSGEQPGIAKAEPSREAEVEDSASSTSRSLNPENFEAGGVVSDPCTPNSVGKDANANATDLKGIDFDAEWKGVLDLALHHEESARKEIQRVREVTQHEPVRHLAELLLDEWDIPAGDPRLQEPQRVWSPTPFDANQYLDRSRPVPPLHITVSGVVSKEGHFENGEIIRSFSNDKTNQAFLEHCRQTLYRPARCGDSGYCEKKIRSVVQS